MMRFFMVSRFVRKCNTRTSCDDHYKNIDDELFTEKSIDWELNVVYQTKGINEPDSSHNVAGSRGAVLNNSHFYNRR
jgi:hypothetical protein